MTKVIINNWKNAEKIERKYFPSTLKKTMWHQRQNYPELIVEDIITAIKNYNNYFHGGSVPIQETILRDTIYTILLKREKSRYLSRKFCHETKIGCYVNTQ